MKFKTPLAHYRTRRARVLQKLSFTVLASGAMLAGPAGRAATDTYIGNGTNTTFATGFNAVPANGDTLVFGPAGSGGTAVSNDSALTVGTANTDGIDFLTSASAYTISGSALTLASSGTGIGINDLSLNLETINTPLTLASSQTVNVGSIDGALTLGGVVSGAFTLTKTGAGLLTLTGGTNTFTNLTVTGGVAAAGGDGNLGSAPGTITLDGGTLRTTGGFTLSTGRGIRLGDAAAGTGGTFDTNNQASAYGGVLVNNGGTNSFTKTGNGTLTLTGANTYTGATNLNLGTLSLDFNGSAATGNILYNGVTPGALVMGGATTLLGAVADAKPGLSVQGLSNVARTQTFGGLTLNAAANQIAARGLGTANVTLAFGAITHNAGGTVTFSNLGSGSTGTGVFTTTNANANGILGGWAVTNATAANATAFQAPTDYATVNGSGQIVAYTGYTAQVAGAVVAGAANNNRVTTANAALTVPAGTTDINTLSNGTGATGTTGVTIATGGTLRLGASGGLFTASGTGAINVSGGTLTAGGAPNTAGEISLIAAGGNSPFTINSVIADNGTGAVTLTYSQYASGGDFTLGGANTYTGGTFLDSGRTVTRQITSFGTGAVTISPNAQAYIGLTGTNTVANDFNIAGASIGNNDTPGAIRLQGGLTLSGKITLLGDATITPRTSTGNAITGQITGNYNLTIAQSGGAGGAITLSNPANNWGGNLITDERVILGASNVLPDGTAAGNVILNSGGTLELNGFSDTINGLNGTATVGQGTVQNTATGASVLTVGGNDQTSTFNGLITDGGAGKTLGLTKTGAGLLILGDVANAYTGGTIINGGTLRLGASSGATNSTIGAITGALTVNTGGTLGLNGFNQTVGNFSGTGGIVTNFAAGTASTFTAGGATNTAFAGSIQNGANGGGTVAFNKQGAGTLDLTGANTYTGATNVTAGTLQIGSGGSLNPASATTLSGTASLALGDANGPVNQTFNSLTTTATTPVFGGGATFSTVTLNNAGIATFANVFGGTAANQNNLNVTIAGTGTTPTTILGGASTYTGFTTVNAGSTLNLAGGSISGSALTLNGGATLTGSGNNSTTGVVGSLTASGGSAITLTGAGGTALRSTGAISLGGTGTYGPGVYTTLNYMLAGPGAVESLNTPAVLTLNSGGAYVNVINPTANGTYTLANYGSLALAGTGTGSFSLSSTTPNVTMLSVGRNTETLVAGTTSLVLTIAGRGSPNVAFFNNAVSSVFNDVTTSSTLVNFSTNRAGTMDAGNVPSANTDVVLVADNAADNSGGSDITATLGASTTLNSLTAIAINANSPLPVSSFTLAADGSTLTIAGVGDNNTSSDGSYTGNPAGNGIRLAAGAAPLNVNVPIIIGTVGASQTWTNNSASDLTVGGTVTSSAAVGSTQTLTLSTTGTGGITLNGVIADGSTGKLAVVVNSTGAGVTTLAAANTYTGGTTVNAGTLTGTVAGGFSTGNVTVDPTGTSGTAADAATLNTTGSIAPTAVLTVNTHSVTAVGTANFNGMMPTIGSLMGNGRVVLNNPGGTALTVGNAANNLSATFSGTIADGAGAGSLVKAGSGIFTLTGANTYTGSTTVNAGTLQVGSATALPANTLAAGAGLVINTGGTLDLNANNVTLSGVPTGSGGTITNAAASGNATLTFSGGTGTLAQTLTNGSGGRLALAVTGGNVAVSAANTFTGGTTITGGTLSTTDNVNSLGANGAGTTVAIANPGAFVINVNGSNTYQDTFSGNGLLKINFTSGGGDTIANNFNNFTGTIELSAPNGATGNKLQIQTTYGAGGALSGATLQIDNNAQYFTGANVTFGTINVQGTGNSENRGAIRLNGNGTTSGVIGGNVFLQGNTTIGSEGGTLTGNISNFAGTTGTQTLTLGTGNASAGILLAGNITDGSGVLALTASNQTTTLTGTSTYSGATTINAGATLQLGNGTTGNDGTIVGTSGIVNNGTLVYNRFGSTASSRVISGTGTVTKTGAGSQTLTAANTYSGGTTITAGALLVNNATGSATGTGAVAVNAGGLLGGGNGAASNGTLSTLGTGANVVTSQTYASGVFGMVGGAVTVASGGTLAPGNSVGTLTVASLTMSAGSLATYEFNGGANDFTVVNGTLTLAGGNFTLLQEGTQNAFAATGTYNLFSYAGGTFSGSTNNLTVANQQPGVTYNFLNDTTDGLIQVQVVNSAVPEPGTWAMLLAGLGALGYARRRRMVAGH